MYKSNNGLFVAYIFKNSRLKEALILYHILYVPMVVRVEEKIPSQFLTET